MPNHTRLFSLWLFLVMLSGSVLLSAVGSARAAGEFFISADGSVSASDQHFSSLQEYVGSKWFQDNGRRCGTTAPVASSQSSDLAAAADCTTTLTNIQQEYYPEGMVLVIPVYFHVIYKADGTGNITDQAILGQMEALNEDYRAMAGTMGSAGFDAMIQFELAGITRTQNDNWFNDNDELGYKTALGQDQTRYLNIYTNSASGYLGYAYFPQSSAGTTIDGVVLLYAAVGGRDNGYDQYDQGRTMVHEVGHYLGLYHTFDSGDCNNTYSSGDLIVDTASEDTAHYSCVQTTTCGTDDPIHNYMNYTPDTCMNEFTPEQGNRMVCALMNYRPSTYRLESLATFDPSTMLQLLLD